MHKASGWRRWDGSAWRQHDTYLKRNKSEEERNARSTGTRVEAAFIEWDSSLGSPAVFSKFVYASDCYASLLISCAEQSVFFVYIFLCRPAGLSNINIRQAGRS